MITRASKMSPSCRLPIILCFCCSFLVVSSSPERRECIADNVVRLSDGLSHVASVTAASTCGSSHRSLIRPGICQTHHFSFTMRFWWLTLSSLTTQGIRVQDSDSLQRLLGSCVQPWLPDETACSERSIREMTTLIDEAVYTVEYASHPISSNGLKSLSELLSFTHSALVITEAWQVFSAEQTQPSALLFEYFARDFGPKAILPASISDGGIPIWENQAVVGWRVAADKGEWLQGANRTTVGTATGKVLNQWFREVVLWGKRHPGYNLFNLWDSTDAVTRKSYMGDSVCHSFTEWSLVDLFRLGADFSIQHPLCRNYFAFITDDSPRKLNMTTPADSQTVLEFYKRLEPLTSQSFHDLPEFSSKLLSAVRGEVSQSPGEVVLFQRGLEDSGAGERLSFEKGGEGAFEGLGGPFGGFLGALGFRGLGGY